jgi:hypothetical protein
MHAENNGEIRRYNGEIRDFLITSFGMSRIFGETFQSKGRIYGCVLQFLSKHIRLSAQFDGIPVYELDFSALHPHILYAMRDVQVEGDLYSIDPDKPGRRALYKALFMAIFNSDSMEQACRMVMSNKGGDSIFHRFRKNSRSAKKLIELGEWREIKVLRDDPDDFYIKKVLFINGQEINPYAITMDKAKSLINHFLEYHSEIAPFAFKKMANKLQNLDSMLMMSILARLDKMRVPAFPIHDSILVPIDKDQEMIQEVMQRAFFSMYGKEIPVTTTVRHDLVGHDRDSDFFATMANLGKVTVDTLSRTAKIKNYDII